MKRSSIVCCLLLSGCTLTAPRIGQKEVPAPILPQITEEQRQSAELLTHGSITPPSLELVADRLSTSLGKPKIYLRSTNVTDIDFSAIVAQQRLEAKFAELQKRIDTQNKFLTKYAGQPIEGTGFSLAGPGMLTIFVILIVVCVACPPVMTLMFFALRRMKAAAGIVVNELEAAAQAEETKEAVSAIKQKIKVAMQAHPDKTTALKTTITNLKS